ncbi:MAG: hypothetical protein OEV29_04275, partial [Thermoleophilia bacterium]|nr:hypothetical protein [Thermoleophilia bacterium]
LHGLIAARIEQLEEQGQVVEPAAATAVEVEEPAAAEVEQTAEAEVEVESAETTQESDPDDAAPAESSTKEE